MTIRVLFLLLGAAFALCSAVLARILFSDNEWLWLVTFVAGNMYAACLITLARTLEDR